MCKFGYIFKEGFDREMNSFSVFFEAYTLTFKVIISDCVDVFSQECGSCSQLCLDIIAVTRLCFFQIE